VPADLAERAWWTRIRRASERQGRAGSKLMSDWARDLLPVRAAPDLELELVAGVGWQPIPPERCTEEYIERETRRLCGELGRALGVGPMP
jgi:hypothetical protein